MHRLPPGFLPHPGMNGFGPPPGGPRPWMPALPAGIQFAGGPQQPGTGPPPVPPPMPPQQHANLNHMRRRPESEYMSADEIESILRIQWRTLHNGPPYLEDYYYQVC